MPREGPSRVPVPASGASGASAGAMYWDTPMPMTTAGTSAGVTMFSLEQDFMGGFTGLASRREQDVVGGSTTESTATDQPAETEFLQWEKYSQQRELGLLKSLVKKCEKKITMRSKELYDKADEKDWAQKHDYCLKEIVGTRTLGGSIDEALLSSDRTGIIRHEITSGATHQRAAASTNAANFNQQRLCDPQTVRDHYDVLKGHKSKDTFAAAARELAKRAYSAGVFPYANALRLVSRVLSRPNQSPEEVALATLSHFSAQFDDWITGRVSQGPGRVATAFTNPRANKIAKFVSIELGAGVETSVWPCLYFSIRCGDAKAAKELFDSTATPNESDEARNSIRNLLTALCQRQGTSASLFEGSGPFTLSPADKRVLEDASELSAQTDARLGVYRRGFLACMGFSVFPTSNLTGFSTVEDYLFGRTSHALHCPSPAEHLNSVGKEIVQFGPSYFQDQDSLGWSYSFPLLASQQFRTALSHLAQVGGPQGRMQAAHIGMFLMGSNGLLNNLQADEKQAMEKLFVSLLVDYSTWLDGQEIFGGVCALEYLQYIPSEKMKWKEVISLIVRTRQVHLLAGNTDSDGARSTKGALDEKFSPSDVSLLLKKAAEKCLNASTGTDRPRLQLACNLYMLSGDFRALITMLCSLMVSNSEVHDTETDYWQNESNRFYSTYLVRRSYVYDSLERSGDLGIIATFSCLIEIARFKAKLHAGEHSEAWSTIDRLDIIPKSQSDVAAKLEKCRSMDPLLKPQVHWVLLGAMRSLFGEYQRLASERQQATENTTAVVLGNLKERSRVILSFAGLLSSTHENVRVQIDTMTKLQACMV